MGTVRADNFSDGAGTGAPDFATGVKVSGGFDSTGDAGVADGTTNGLTTKNRWQKKVLGTGVVGTTGVISDLSFTGLSTSKDYRISWFFNASSFDTGEVLHIELEYGGTGTVITRAAFVIADTNASASALPLSGSVVFRPTATSTEFDIKTMSAGVTVSATTSSATIEELNNYAAEVAVF